MAGRRRGTRQCDFFSFYYCLTMHRHPLHDDRRPFSAIISFSFTVLLLLQVKPSKYLFRHLLPYPASLRRWKCPSLLERPWTCPTETRRKLLDVDGTFVTRRVRAAMGGPHAQCPHCYFFCYFVIHSLQLDGVLYKPPLVSLGRMTSIRLVGISLVLLRYHKHYSYA